MGGFDRAWLAGQERPAHFGESLKVGDHCVEQFVEQFVEQLVEGLRRLTFAQ